MTVLYKYEFIFGDCNPVLGDGSKHIIHDIIIKALETKITFNGVFLNRAAFLGNSQNCFF